MAGDPARVDRKVRSLAKTWNALGARDPLWAVLTDPSKRGRRWDPADFFANGEAEIAAVESELQALDLFPGRHLAVDFGCGVGRLSRALASRFEGVIGLDIAASMITEAKRLNRDVSNIQFVLNVGADLSPIADRSVDLFYSRLVFQHVDPALTLRYLAELGRVMAAGGVAVFQIPSARPKRSIVSRAARAVLRPIRDTLAPGPRMAMFPVPPAEVERVVSTAGLRMVSKRDDESAPPWPSKLYFAIRN